MGTACEVGACVCVCVRTHASPPGHVFPTASPGDQARGRRAASLPRLGTQKPPKGSQGTPGKGLSWRHQQIEPHRPGDTAAGSMVDSTPVVS